MLTSGTSPKCCYSFLFSEFLIIGLVPVGVGCFFPAGLIPPCEPVSDSCEFGSFASRCESRVAITEIGREWDPEHPEKSETDKCPVVFGPKHFRFLFLVRGLRTINVSKLTHYKIAVNC